MRVTMTLVVWFVTSLLAGCLHAPKHATAPEAWPLGLRVELASLDTSESVALSEASRRSLEEACRLRGLAVTTPGEAPVEMQISAQARWYAQLAGRYRWTVETQLRLIRPGSDEVISETSFEVPVFLLYDHQREDAAFEEALPVVERQLGDLLDRWIEAAD